MSDDDANTPTTTLAAALPRRVGPPTGPRSAGLAMVLPPPAALVVDLDAHRARTSAPTLVVLSGGAVDAAAASEAGLSIQDRVRLRAQEAQVAPSPGSTPPRR